MAELDKKGVLPDPPTGSEKDEEVETESDKEKDKLNNLVELRKKNQQLEKDLAEERKLRQEETDKRKLDVKDEDEDDEEEEDEEKDKKKSKSKSS